MTVYTVTVKHEFCSGHRILGQGGKCESPHGHNYRVYVSIRASQLDDRDMVADFSPVKSAIRKWVDEHWDHAFLVDSRDDLMLSAMSSIPQAKVYVFEHAKPTAETMASTLGTVLTSDLGIPICSVRLWETDRQYAEVDFSG